MVSAWTYCTAPMRTRTPIENSWTMAAVKGAGRTTRDAKVKKRLVDSVYWARDLGPPKARYMVTPGDIASDAYGLSRR